MLITTLHLKYYKGDEIPRRKIKQVWNEMFPQDTLPKIEAYSVSKKHLMYLLKQKKKHDAQLGIPNLLEINQMEEWGKVIPEPGAVVMRLKHKHYLMLVRNDTPKSVMDHLKHELNHIHNGDPDRIRKKEKDYGEN